MIYGCEYTLRLCDMITLSKGALANQTCADGQRVCITSPRSIFGEHKIKNACAIHPFGLPTESKYQWHLSLTDPKLTYLYASIAPVSCVFSMAKNFPSYLLIQLHINIDEGYTACKGLVLTC